MDSYKAAWLEIAEAFGTPYEERTEKQRRIAYDGLCDAFDQCADLSICGQMQVMIGRMWLCRPRWPGGLDSEEEKTSNDNWRCMVACLFAAMTPEERKEIGLPV